MPLPKSVLQQAPTRKTLTSYVRVLGMQSKLLSGTLAVSNCSNHLGFRSATCGVHTKTLTCLVLM